MREPSDQKIPVAPLAKYTFEWRGVTFDSLNCSSHFQGAKPALEKGQPWSAAVSIDGWQWTARLTVNGGTVSAVSATPWQALDATLVAWKDIVEELTRES